MLDPVGANGSPSRAFWERTGSVLPDGTFKRYLHLFCLAEAFDVSNLVGPHWLPWVEIDPEHPVELVPNGEALLAYYHVTLFKNMPMVWHDFWFYIEQMVESCRARPIHGPYWFVSTRHGHHVPSEVVRSYKRAIRREHAIQPVDSFEAELLRRLDKYRVIVDYPHRRYA